ncbi:hypothetical protein D3Z60_10605 [Lachnospiraceae bacterium]|nr:hypothetical protein [Lachnospiraceae bacterium]
MAAFVYKGDCKFASNRYIYIKQISQTKIVSMKMRNSEEKREDSEAVQGGIVKSLIQNFAAEGETGSDENFTSGRRY